MHSGTVFWGTKEELRAIMTVMEKIDAQVQMFEREEGDWALHVNFAGGELSRLYLENIRLSEQLAEARDGRHPNYGRLLRQQVAAYDDLLSEKGVAPITAEDIIAATRAWDEVAGDRISDHEDENLWAGFVAERLNRR